MLGTPSSEPTVRVLIRAGASRPAVVKVDEAYRGSPKCAVFKEARETLTKQTRLIGLP
jgi:hypothetical protein